MKINDISIDQIIADDNIRDNYEDIEELAESIKTNGLLSPVIVSLITPGKYKLIVGHRRYLACKSLGLLTIPAIVKDINNVKVIQLVENVQRSNLNKLESSKTVYALLTDMNISSVSLSRMINKSDGWVNDRKSYYIIYTFLESHKIDSLELLTFVIANALIKYPKDEWLYLAPKLLGNKYHAAYVVKKDIDRWLYGSPKVKIRKKQKITLDLSNITTVLQKFPISKISPLRYTITFASESHGEEILNVLKKMGGTII